MTSRAGKPDTYADLRIRNLLTTGDRKNFVVVAGAGSGKTTSLIKGLESIQATCGSELRRQGRRVACITYTEIAVEEIWGDVGNDPLFHVSTIHSFIWTLIRPFQRNIAAWVASRIEQKIVDKQAEQAQFGPRVHQKTKDRAAQDVLRYESEKASIVKVKSYTYGLGSDYPNGILGHDDIIKLGPAMLAEHELLRQITAQKFPFIFVDESQDTSPDVVKALKEVASYVNSGFTLAFIGDPMQRIYTTGIGDITPETGWEKIDKPENFRCATRVLSVINNIRAGSDSLVQTPGRTVTAEGAKTLVEGTARIFIVPIDDFRTERLAALRAWIAGANSDPLWTSDDRTADVKLLVLVHRVAAIRLGFGNLYSALNDGAPTSISEGFADGSLWAVKPFTEVLLPLIEAKTLGHNLDVISLLRKHSPKLSPPLVRQNDVATTLVELSEGLDVLEKMLAVGSDKSIFDVIHFAQQTKILILDERFDEHLASKSNHAEVEEPTAEVATIGKYFDVKAEEMWGYRTYITDQSPFSTQQGIKGAEFERVLTVIDEEEGKHVQFSYAKLFGIAPLSDTDLKHLNAHEETVVDRTRRLFYVCCSRALTDLAVVVFASDVDLTERKVRETRYFPPEDIHVFLTK